MDRFDRFVTLLSQIPISAWEAAVTNEPEWKWLQPRSRDWEFGRFAALFTVLGLNDYQTKGKAEVGYWPEVVPLIPRKPAPDRPTQLIDILGPFFERERLGQTKVKRLKRFVRSDLCSYIWSAEPSSLARGFPLIWRRLGEEMQQDPKTKTIAFAMKCLALALLMVGEDRFDFSAVPVPVDSRIRNLSTRLGAKATGDYAERRRWQSVLAQLRESHPQVTMVHLDSLLWQIGNLSREQMRTHLVNLSAGESATAVSELFDGST